MKCSVTDCGRKHQARGYCAAHYQRLMRYGDPTVGRPLREQVNSNRADRLDATPLLHAIDRRADVIIRRLTYADEQHVKRARTRGWIDAHVADRIAVKVLGMHPALIFGDAWWLLDEVAA